MAIQVALRNKAEESATILPANANFLKLSGNFGESDMQLTGSNPQMLVDLINSNLFPADARLLERKDLEKTMKRQKDFLSGFYVDFGLNLDSRDTAYKINPVYAKPLAEALTKVGINLKNAKLIPYNILTKNFRLSEKGKDTAKTCIKNTDDFKWDYKPSSSGLFGACLVRSGNWDCGDESLANSDEYGRVVVVSGKASSQKFLDVYISKFKEDRDKSIADANKKYAEMKTSLRVA